MNNDFFIVLWAQMSTLWCISINYSYYSYYSNFYTTLDSGGHCWLLSWLLLDMTPVVWHCVLASWYNKIFQSYFTYFLPLELETTIFSKSRGSVSWKIVFRDYSLGIGIKIIIYQYKPAGNVRMSHADFFLTAFQEEGTIA